MLWTDAFAGVLHGDVQEVVLHARSQRDRSFAFDGLMGVVHQIEEHLIEPAGNTADRTGIATARDGDIIARRVGKKIRAWRFIKT